MSSSALSALDEGFDVFVVADACGGLSLANHDLALRRLEQAGARLCSWIQVLLEFQRDWTRNLRLGARDRRCERRRLWNGTRVRARDDSSGLNSARSARARQKGRSGSATWIEHGSAGESGAQVWMSYGHP